MKTISLLEPWASLIKEKVKYIETRSWNTNYRGELYIHASKKKLTRNDLINYKEQISLLKDKNFKYGHIIAKCNLVDCKYMTEDFINEIKKNYNEYICGSYEVGRHAWILENIEMLDEPIEAKGQLGIWNYNNEKQIMKFMDEIDYGWIDKKNNKHIGTSDSMLKNYILQNPKETIKNKVGICWDQVELERYYFNNLQSSIKTYFLCHYDDDVCPAHTFLVYKKNNYFYWFEHSWKKYRGIHKFTSLKSLLVDVREKFIIDELNCTFMENQLVLYEYEKPRYGISVIEFYKHCACGKNIDIDGL